MTLYDYERDGDIKEGEAIVIYEDGTRKRTSIKRLFPRGEDGEQREQADKHTFRGRLAGASKRRKSNARQVAPKRRIPLRKA